METDTSWHGSRIDSIFFGGGTPTLMDPIMYQRILDTVRRDATLTSDCEITTEANPGTIRDGFFEHLIQTGVNRISFGVQSFRPDELTLLERSHSTNDVPASIHAARAAGYQNISLDLIFALPDQSVADWEYNLRSALELEPTHLSAYSLIFEPNTPFYNRLKQGQLKAVDESLEREMMALTLEQMSSAGYLHYEVSNYASAAHLTCRHNLRYWQYLPYYSFGPSSHSFDGLRQRYWKIRSIEKYIEKLMNGKSVISGRDQLDDDARITELIMLGFRLRKGIDLSRFREITGVDFKSHFAEQIAQFERQYLLRINETYCYLTEDGIYYTNEIISRF